MGKFRPPWAPKTPERISMKLGNYVGDMTTHANPHGAATTWVVSACYMFRFLSILFFFFTLVDRF